MKELTSLFALLNFVFHLVHSHSESCKSVYFDTCSIEERSCVIHEDSLIESLAVTDLEECRQRCGALENCQYFSHFGANSFPFSDTCILFSSCEELNECPDCMTTNTNCGIVEKEEPCNSTVEGHIGQNLLAFHTDVANQSSCQAFCYSLEGCNYYTYHDSSDNDLPGACILLSNILPPLKTCLSCQTGVMDCSKRCFFLGGDHGEDEVIYGGVKIVDTHQTINVQPVALGVCRLVAVAAREHRHWVMDSPCAEHCDRVGGQQHSVDSRHRPTAQIALNPHHRDLRTKLRATKASAARTPARRNLPRRRRRTRFDRCRPR